MGLCPGPNELYKYNDIEGNMITYRGPTRSELFGIYKQLPTSLTRIETTIVPSFCVTTSNVRSETGCVTVSDSGFSNRTLLSVF